MGCCKPGWWESSNKVLVLHWRSILRARALDVHVKLLFFTYIRFLIVVLDMVVLNL